MFAIETREPIIVKKELPVRSEDRFDITVLNTEKKIKNTKIIHKEAQVVVFLDDIGNSISVFTSRKSNYYITCTAEDAQVDGVLNISTMKYTRNKDDFKKVLKPLELGDEVEVCFNGENFENMTIIFTNKDKIVGVVSELKDTIVEFSKSSKSECCDFTIADSTIYQD
jgi:hypothetical protein